MQRLNVVFIFFLCDGSPAVFSNKRTKEKSKKSAVTKR